MEIVGQGLFITFPGQSPPRKLLRTFETLEYGISEDGIGAWCTPHATPMLETWERENVDEGPRTIMCAGMLPLVRKFLEREGYEVSVTVPGDLRRPVPPGPDGVPTDPTLLEFIRFHDRGLIRTGPGRVSRAELIAQVARAWPKKRIIAIATREADASQLYVELRTLLPDVGLQGARGATKRAASGNRRVMVATRSCAYASLESRNICFMLDPGELFCGGFELGWSVLHALRRARLYGFVGHQKFFPPGIRDLVLACFGVEECNIPSHGMIPLPVNVALLPSKARGREPHGNVFEIRRDSIWRHNQRNRVVGHIARLFAHGEMGQLEARFPRVSRIAPIGPSKVGILAGDITHAVVLASRLGWRLITHRKVDTEGLPPRDAEKIRELVRIDTPNFVATPTGLCRADVPDVLIRADGGSGLPPFSPEQSMTNSREPRSLLIVDFHDRFHRAVREWFRRRRKAYADVGWSVAGFPPEHPLDRYLAERESQKSAMSRNREALEAVLSEMGIPDEGGTGR